MGDARGDFDQVAEEPRVDENVSMRVAVSGGVVVRDAEGVGGGVTVAVADSVHMAERVKLFCLENVRWSVIVCVMVRVSGGSTVSVGFIDAVAFSSTVRVGFEEAVGGGVTVVVCVAVAALEFVTESFVALTLSVRVLEVKYDFVTVLVDVWVGGGVIVSVRV